MIFVDTCVWFAANVPQDRDHLLARDLLRGRQSSLVTTDYVLCELFTLLKVRGQRSRLPLAGRAFFEQRVCRIEHVSPSDVVAAWNVFERFRDKDWSFTDCTSYVVMRRLGINRGRRVRRAFQAVWFCHGAAVKNFTNGPVYGEPEVQRLFELRDA